MSWVAAQYGQCVREVMMLRLVGEGDGPLARSLVEDMEVLWDFLTPDEKRFFLEG